MNKASNSRRVLTDVAKQSVLNWVEDNKTQLSDDHQTIWRMAEPAWREYQASAWFVDRLRTAGFEVEQGTAGMPTAFSAEWVAPSGSGPAIASYAEYDAVPGNSQEAVPFKQPLFESHESAPGFIDPHSALAIGSLAGILAAQSAIREHGLRGTLRFFGEPAENMCGGKCRHASHGFYDSLDAVLTWRPSSSSILANTCMWDVHCGCFWSVIFTFQSLEPSAWQSDLANQNVRPARSPGALDALCLMYTTTKYTKEAMLPAVGGWSLNEAILSNASTTANNHAPRFAQIQYSWRCPTIEMAQRVFKVLENNAQHVAAMTHTQMHLAWVSKTRPGLQNHALATVTSENLRTVGAPQWDGQALTFANACRASLGLVSTPEPLDARMSQYVDPEVADLQLRTSMPAWQQHQSADDYVEYTWHAPTARFLVGRPCLASQNDSERFPAWVNVALGGFPSTIDPTIRTAAKVIGMTVVELLSDPGKLAECQSEFEYRTGGGIGGDLWQAPLLDQSLPAPVNFPWPNYCAMPNGRTWMISSKL